MTVVLKSTHKAAVIGWSKEAIHGSDASISVRLNDGTEQEKRVVRNDGEANLFFPRDYVGVVFVTIDGSHGGTESGHISVA